MRLRAANATDDDAIRTLNDEAFGGADESAIVDRLRADGLAVIELVAVEENRAVGHLMLSKLTFMLDGRSVNALALAPMSVTPSLQRRGIGGALVKESIARAKSQGFEAIIVVGHPDYYPRFGFSSKLATVLNAPFSGPAFMALELKLGALSGSSGDVVYPSLWRSRLISNGLSHGTHWAPDPQKCFSIG